MEGMMNDRKIPAIRPFGSLRVRMALSIMGVVVLIMVVGVAIDAIQEYRIHWTDTVNSLQEQARAIQVAKSRIPDEGSFAEYVDEVCAMMNAEISPGHHILVLHPGGEVLASARHHRGHEVEQALLAARADQSKFTVNGRELAQVRIKDRDGSTIIVAQYLDHMTALLNERLRRDAISIGLIASVAAAFVFVTLGKWVLEHFA